MKRNLHTSIITTAMALLLFLVGSANAATIAGVSIHAFSSEFPGREATKVIDGSGFDGTFHNNGAGDMWLTQCCAPVDPNPFIVFDLGAVYDVDSLQVWNYNEGTGGGLSDRGVNDVTVEFGTTAALGSTVAGITNFAVATDSNGYAGEDFNNGTVATTPFPITARFIKFDIDSQHGPVADSFGLSEVRFDGVEVVDPFAPVKITGVTAVATSELTLNNFNRVVGNIVDGVGADTVIPDGLPGDFNGSWLNNGTFTTPNNPVLDTEVVFDLGAIERIAEMMVFNYNENETVLLTSRGADEVIISVSNDNFVGDDRLVGPGTFFFDEATGALGLTGQTIDFGGIEGQFVKFDFVSSHGGDNGFVGLNEVMFFRATVVPEPATATLALLGLGGLVMRRRRAA